MGRVREDSSVIRHGVGNPGHRGANPVTAITFSCAAILFSIVYNLRRHQNPVPLKPCPYSVGG